LVSELLADGIFQAIFSRYTANDVLRAIEMSEKNSRNYTIYNTEGDKLP